MKAEELRLGNQLEGGVVVGIHKEYFIIDDGYQCWRSDKMVSDWTEGQSIPLTEEWLLKFGFKYTKRKDGTQGVYSNGKINLQLSNSGNIYTMRNKLVPYVHILQNYYYFQLLTGEELKTTT